MAGPPQWTHFPHLADSPGVVSPSEVWHLMHSFPRSGVHRQAWPPQAVHLSSVAMGGILPQIVTVGMDDNSRRGVTRIGMVLGYFLPLNPREPALSLATPVRVLGLSGSTRIDAFASDGGWDALAFA